VGGRDRNVARNVVRSMTSKVSAVSGCVAKGHQTMTLRFHKPPYDPGQPDFPGPVLTLILLRSPSHKARSLSADPHTPLHFMVCFQGRSPMFTGPTMSGYSWSHQVPRAPLHAPGVTFRVGNVQRPVSRNYPAFIAHTGSCVNPKPSYRLRS